MRRAAHGSDRRPAMRGGGRRRVLDAIGVAGRGADGRCIVFILGDRTARGASPVRDSDSTQCEQSSVTFRRPRRDRAARASPCFTSYMLGRYSGDRTIADSWKLNREPPTSPPEGAA